MYAKAGINHFVTFSNFRPVRKLSLGLSFFKLLLTTCDV